MMPKKQPDQLATLLGHAVVGIGVAYVAGRLVKAAIVPAIMVGAIAVLVHAALDQPVAQGLSELGL
jgi:hypothetical protein